MKKSHDKNISYCMYIAND